MNNKIDEIILSLPLSIKPINGISFRDAHKSFQTFKKQGNTWNLSNKNERRTQKLLDLFINQLFFIHKNRQKHDNYKYGLWEEPSCTTYKHWYGKYSMSDNVEEDEDYDQNNNIKDYGIIWNQYLEYIKHHGGLRRTKRNRDEIENNNDEINIKKIKLIYEEAMQKK